MEKIRKKSKKIAEGIYRNMSFRNICLMLVSIVLSACSSYKSSFSCPDSRGANCMAMDQVDEMISNGEIEEYTKQEKRGKICKKGRCKEDRDIYETLNIQVRQQGASWKGSTKYYNPGGKEL